MANETQVICKNVFKNDNPAAFKRDFNKKWLELINQREKSQRRAAPR